MDGSRSFMETPAGRIAYTERGEGPAALFVHGVFLHGDLWNGVVDRVAGVRRCVCPDLRAHGWTEDLPEADLSFAGQADMLSAFLDGLGVDQVDLVGNDSGGGIAQILAARHPDRIRSLTLTNCDTHDGWPPDAFKPAIELITGEGGTDALKSLAANPEAARSAFGMGLEHPENLTDELIESFFGRLVASPERIDAFVRFFRAFDCADTVAVEPLLKQLQAPALIVWGGADTFFDRKWAYWLRDTLGNVSRLVEIPSGKLFLPLDRPKDLAEELLVHWQALAPQYRASGAG